MLVEQDIGRFEIAMDDALLMGEVEGGREGGKELSHIGSGGERFLIRGSAQILGEVHSFDVVHHDVGQGLLAFLGRADMEAMQTHNIGMLQGSDEPGLADAWQVAEAGHEIGISQQGVQWQTVGENIGEGGPVSSNDDAWNMVSMIHQGMMAEKPPDDGHRRNLLSKDFHRIGISIYIDAHHTLWLTEDFAD